MADLRNIKDMRTDTISIIRPKWYKERYELTDGVYTYANIYSKGWKQTTFIETADETLSICMSWKGGLTLKDVSGEVIGTTKCKAFSRRTTLNFNNGRSFTHYNPSVWKNEFIWVDEFENELIRIKFGSLSGKATVNIVKKNSDIPDFYKLVFLGLKLHLIKMAMAV